MAFEDRERIVAIIEREAGRLRDARPNDFILTPRVTRAGGYRQRLPGTGGGGGEWEAGVNGMDTEKPPQERRALRKDSVERTAGIVTKYARPCSEDEEREASEDAWLERAERHLPKSLGVGDSGTADTSERAGDERPEPRAWR